MAPSESCYICGKIYTTFVLFTLFLFVLLHGSDAMWSICRIVQVFKCVLGERNCYRQIRVTSTSRKLKMRVTIKNLSTSLISSYFSQYDALIEMVQPRLLIVLLSCASSIACLWNLCSAWRSRFTSADETVKILEDQAVHIFVIIMDLNKIKTTVSGSQLKNSLRNISHMGPGFPNTLDVTLLHG